MSNIFKAIKNNHEIIETILSSPERYDGWSLQGFGLLRLYLTKELRLHVWDARFAIKDVSLIHTHPWDFESYVLSGRLTNFRYEKVAGDTHLGCVIQCGENAQLKNEPEPCHLKEVSKEILFGGQTYHQKADEIHLSQPADGTVTLIERTFKADTEHAWSFWSKGAEWTSAAPRPATKEEVKWITSKALSIW